MARVPGATQVERGHLPAEREVLRVLWNSPDEHLVRSEIYRRMLQAHKPSLGRVGQLLAELKAADLVVTKKKKAQGSREAAFYQLSERGLVLCRDLGFERRAETLFPISEEEQRTVLTRERLAHCPEEPGRIAAFYGYRGGIGRTTATAYAAIGIAEKLDQESVLVVDLDISAPGLERFFDPPERCRGLAGIILDYQRRAASRRELWMRGAVTSEEYVHRPFSDTSNLAFMPSGFVPGSNALTPTEHAEAIALLGAKVTHDIDGFFIRLREAFLDRYGRTLIDAQTGRGLSPWVATQVLADELVLFLRMTDTDCSNLCGLRAVLASFLSRHEDAGVILVFPTWEPVPTTELNLWIDRHLVSDIGGTAEPSDYKAQVLVYDPPLVNHLLHDQNSTRTYAALVAHLTGRGTEAPPLASPNLDLLTMVLDPKRSRYWRDLAAGVLTNKSFQDLGRLLDLYKTDPSIPRETDEFGHVLIDNIIRGHERRIRSILPKRSTQRTWESQ